MVSTAAEKLYVERSGMAHIDNSGIEKAKKRFEAFKKNGCRKIQKRLFEKDQEK